METIETAETQLADTAQQLEAAQAELQALREVVANTEDVGERFADEARAMHHGEAAHRQIRGQASPQEALELMEEGIDVIALPAFTMAAELVGTGKIKWGEYRKGLWCAGG